MRSLNKYTVTPAEEWTKLFKRNSGWFGGDGIFSFSLDGKESFDVPKDSLIIYFSDTFIGEVIQGKPKKYKMVHNSFARYLDNGVLDFFYNLDQKGVPSSLFSPGNEVEDSYFFWLGDGFVNTRHSEFD